jgi:hypothetical protein
MKISTLYDQDLDYLEVIQTGVENYATPVSDQLQIFRSEIDGSVVGFALEKTSQIFGVSSKELQKALKRINEKFGKALKNLADS